MSTLYGQPAPSLPLYSPRTAPDHPLQPQYQRFAAALASLGWPEFVSIGAVCGADAGLAEWVRHPGNRRKIEGYMGACGYARYMNPEEKRGRWYVDGQQRGAWYRRPI